jgi:hypothetical protein
MVVACIALLVALAGTSVAAVKIVVPRNSVGPLQLQPNSVTSAKVRNGSLLKVDFKSGQLPRGPVGPRGAPGPVGPTGPAGPAGPAGASGVAAPGYVAQVLTTSSTASPSTTSTNFTDVNNAALNVTVPSGETDQVVVFFSAASACSGGSQLRTCHVRILVDGNELAPSVGGNSNWDNNDNGVKTTGCGANPCTSANLQTSFNPKSASEFEERSMVRYSGNLSAGTHTVKVQFETANSSTTIKLTEWSLVVQRVRVA